jgi:hypothetical protein
MRHQSQASCTNRAPRELPHHELQEEALIKVSVMYPNKPGVRFDHEYYRTKHLPLIKSRMGAALKYYAIDKGLADREGRPLSPENGPKLSIFEQRDHGSLLQIAGRRRNAPQYEIGNPFTASKMTRHQLLAALYAPLRVLFLRMSKAGEFLNMTSR